MRDTLRWGEDTGSEEEWIDEVLSEGDEELITALSDLCGDAEVKETMEMMKEKIEEKTKQKKMTDWIVKSDIVRRSDSENTARPTEARRKPLHQKSIFALF